MKLKRVLGALAIVTLAGCASNPGTASAPSGAIAISVTEHGFEPELVRVPAGRPVTLVVTRRTDRTCAKEIVLAEQSIRKALPLNQPVEITFTPSHAGMLRYACGMDMIAGRIEVQ